MFVDDADAVAVAAAAAADVLAIGVGVAAADEDDGAVDMPFNGRMGNIEYLIATSLMPHGGGSMASTEALKSNILSLKIKFLKGKVCYDANRFTLSHFLIASDRLAVLVESITRSGVGKATRR